MSEEMTDRLFVGIPIDETTPVQYVGVYVLKWLPEWGEPTIGFYDAPGKYKDVSNLLEQLKEMRSLLQTGCAPDAFNMTEEDWLRHKGFEIEGALTRLIERIETK